MISLKAFAAVQSELQVTMEEPGGDGAAIEGTCEVTCEDRRGPEKSGSCVGVVFTD